MSKNTVLGLQKLWARAAPWSAMTVRSLCGRKAETGFSLVTGPWSNPARACCLVCPVARTRIFRASRIVPMPMVTAWVGISSRLNTACMFVRVVSANSTMRVLESRAEPGSLNAMCPLVPTPAIRRSIPPAALISLSYSAHAVLSAVESRRRTFCGWMLT